MEEQLVALPHTSNALAKDEGQESAREIPDESPTLTGLKMDLAALEPALSQNRLRIWSKG